MVRRNRSGCARCTGPCARMVRHPRAASVQGRRSVGSDCVEGQPNATDVTGVASRCCVSRIAIDHATVASMRDLWPRRMEDGADIDAPKSFRLGHALAAPSIANFDRIYCDARSPRNARLGRMDEAIGIRRSSGDRSWRYAFARYQSWPAGDSGHEPDCRNSGGALSTFARCSTKRSRRHAVRRLGIALGTRRGLLTAGADI